MKNKSKIPVCVIGAGRIGLFHEFDKKRVKPASHVGMWLKNKDCELLARGEIFKNQAFKYHNCYALQFHPEVNFFVHLRWLFLVLMKKPKVLFLNGSQNLFYQLYLRFKHNKSVSMWLDSFLDNYLLAQK